MSQRGVKLKRERPQSSLIESSSSDYENEDV